MREVTKNLKSKCPPGTGLLYATMLGRACRYNVGGRLNAHYCGSEMLRVL